jgi:hypothetical protein
MPIVDLEDMDRLNVASTSNTNVILADLINGHVLDLVNITEHIVDIYT